MEKTNEIKQDWNRQKQTGIFFSKKSDQSFFSGKETKHEHLVKFCLLYLKFCFACGKQKIH